MDVCIFNNFIDSSKTEINGNSQAPLRVTVLCDTVTIKMHFNTLRLLSNVIYYWTQTSRDIKDVLIVLRNEK